MVSDSVNVKGLMPGVHVLYIRCVDSLGKWSHYTSMLFSVEFGITKPVFKAEMFVDKNDPGIGKAIGLKGNFPANHIILADSVNLSGMGLGVHSLTIRSFDEEFMSSTFEKRIFSVIPDNNASIVYAEWFIDIDPGMGKANSVLVKNPSDSIKISGEINVPLLSYGKHFLYFRTKDKNGFWSHYAPKEFYICATYGPEPDFGYDYSSMSVDGLSKNIAIIDNLTLYSDSFVWKINNNYIGNQKHISYVFDSVGEFNICLTAVNSCGNAVICKKIINSGIVDVIPKKLKYDGYFRLKVYGYGFSEKTDIKLVSLNYNHIITPDSIVLVSPNYLIAIFKNGPPLNNYEDKKYKVIFINNGLSYEDLNNNCLIEIENSKTSAPLFFPKIDIIAPSSIIVNRYYDAFIYYDNSRSNTFGVGIPIIIRTSGNLEAVLVSQVSDSGLIDSSVKKYLPWQRFYKYYRDTINHTDSFNIAMIMIKELMPGEKGYIHFLIKNTKMDSFVIEANILPPWYEGAWLDTIGYRTNCKKLPPCMQCLLDILNIYGSITVFMGCIVSVIELGCAIAGNFGNTSNLLDLMSAVSSAIISCVAPALPDAYKLLQSIASAVGLMGSMDGMDQKDAICNTCQNDITLTCKGFAMGSYDPNSKLGPAGIKSEHYITGENPLNYIIHFENVDTATAPAAEVKITDRIDTSFFDISSLEFVSFGYANKFFNISPNVDSFSFEKSLKPEKNSTLRVQGYIDTLSSTVNVHFISLEPKTGKLTQVVSDGFLNPNDSNHSGEGFVMFRIKLKDKFPHLTKISNEASIIFDQNEQVKTPVWSNTIDIESPVSSVNQLPSTIHDTIFTVKWHGTDNESGIGFYWVYFSENGGQWQKWLNTHGLDSAVFVGKLGNTYAFYCLAADLLGNLEQKQPLIETQTTVTTSIKIPDKKSEVNGYMLYVYPNPFQGKTTIAFNLPYGTEIKLVLTDALGKEIKVLKNGYFDKGLTHFELNGNDYTSGIYNIKLTTKDCLLNSRLIIK